MKAKVVKYLDLPIALVSLWVPPAPGMVPWVANNGFDQSEY